jgi:ABC-type glycerol-3-phosphate transport system substrate-binding protein
MPFRVKRAILGFYFVVISFMLTGCTIPVLGIEVTFPEWVPFIGGESRTPITLEYWGLWEPASVMQPVFDSFKTQREFVSVSYQVRDPRQHFETVRARLTTDDPPDIVRVHATWLPYLYSSLEPLPADVMDATAFINSFYPVVAEDMVINGQVYGVPLGLDGLALVYNDNLFKQEGLTIPPTNWDIFLEYAQKLTKKNDAGQIVQGGAALGYADNIDYFSDILGMMFAQNGVTFVDDQGMVKFHQSFSPTGDNLGADALQFYAKFSDSAQSYNPAWENSTQAFLDGQVAMVFVPSYKLNDILAQRPDFVVKVAKAPQFAVLVDGGKNWASYWVEVVPKNGQRPKESWRLLTHMMQKDQLVTMYRNASEIRGFGELYPRPDLADTLKLEQRVAPYIEQFPTATSWSFADMTHDVILNDKIIQALAQAIRGTQGNEEAAGGALNRAAEDVQLILNSFKT